DMDLVGSTAAMAIAGSSEAFATSYAVGVSASGKIVMGGTVGNDDLFMAVGRRLADGSVDNDFSGDGARGYSQSEATVLTIQPDGRYILAGTRELYEGVILRVWD